jgi:hypothetical protein
MSRRSIAVWCAVPAALVLAWAAAPAAPWSLGSPPRGDVLAVNLQQTVDFGGLDDPKITLREVLDKLAKDYDLTFEVNEAAFKFAMVEDVLKKEVASPNAIQAMKGVRVETVLRKILERIPSGGAPNSAATILLRRDHVEITTGTMLALEVGTEDVPGLQYPLVHLTPTQRPLEEWLDALSEQTGQNIYLDPMVGQRGRALVGTRLYNVPLDVAVHLLSSGAGLKTVEVANVLCVTGKENVQALLSSPIPRLTRAQTARRVAMTQLDEGDPSPLSVLPKP